MKLRLANWLRFKTANYFAYRPNRASRALFRTGLMFVLMTARAPWSVVRELAFGQGADPLDLKSAARAVVWVMNRSWLPFKVQVGTFFDISLVLSEPSCRELRDRGFVSRDPFKRNVDLAQYQLSTLQAGLMRDERDVWGSADHELCELVDEILQSACHRMAGKSEEILGLPGSPDAREMASTDASGGFHNDRTRATLLDFDSLCSGIGQEYFLVSGTFLGAVRDGEFIGHDHDIDLGVFEDALAPDFLTSAESSDCFVVTRVEYAFIRVGCGGKLLYQKSKKPILIRLVHESGVAIDVFVHFRDENWEWHGTSAQRWDNRPFELAKYDFIGHSFNGAADFDCYLSENYGSDWRTPKTAFDSNFDTPNISFMRTANGLVFCAWAMAKSIAEDRPERVKQYLDILGAAGAIEPWNDTFRVRQRGTA